MHRFFVSPENLSKELIPLNGETHHHLRSVLRLRPQSEILILDGRGQICRCRLERVEAKSSLARVLVRWWERETALPMKLLQGIPKGDKMTQILQKGTELGITEFQPVLTEHGIARVPAERRTHIQRRWETIVREAARQCCRPLLPVLHPPLDLGQALAGCREELRLLLWEKASSPLAAALPEKAPDGVALLVGPEGGISDQEAALAERHRFLPVRLGPRILRTETAGWTIAAILQHCYGDLNLTEGEKAHRPEKQDPA